MNSLGVSISMLHPIMKVIGYKGFNVQQFCEYAQFNAELLKDVEARISEEELERITRKAAEYTGDDYFGLHQGQMLDIVDMGTLGLVMMHSEKVEDALKAYQRYNVILCSGFQLDYRIEGEDFVLRLYLKDSTKKVSRHCMEDMASSLFHVMIKMTSEHIQLHDIKFTHPAPDSLTPYLHVLGREPKFDQHENSLRFSKAVLEYPILYSDVRLQSIFEKIAEDAKQKIVQQPSFGEEVCQWLMDVLPHTLPTLQQTAEAFNMSVRSLQAKLKQEDTSYNQLSAQIRKELAMSFLQTNSYSIGEIAYLLHFSEPSAFQVAFKKWTGVTPGQFRGQTVLS
ncbi:AraC family transcriptional regulator [Bacillus horti]|uniref:AraC-like DNA-binding protein n=1 Tax=Caldalkalibacillus horti TaxID=77523 RepID=A0ABT9VWN7_9BACI|nr:AraC family transcriptional regulator [Bacillus horti]MDQ0165412.1 AraC-like DNA-binding protein [Bacillus horti]